MITSTFSSSSSSPGAGCKATIQGTPSCPWALGKKVMSICDGEPRRHEVSGTKEEWISPWIYWKTCRHSPSLVFSLEKSSLPLKEAVFSREKPYFLCKNSLPSIIRLLHVMKSIERENIYRISTRLCVPGFCQESEQSHPCKEKCRFSSDNAICSSTQEGY